MEGIGPANEMVRQIIKMLYYFGSYTKFQKGGMISDDECRKGQN